MDTEGEAARLRDLMDDVIARLDDLEAELDEEVAAGQDRLTELTVDLRGRVDALRGTEPEPEPTRVEQLREDYEELRMAVEAEVESGSEALATILGDVNRRLRRLERAIRER